MPTYDFHMLSPADFEEFCRDLLSAHLSCHVESFRTGRDDGIDLRYTKCNTTTIVQCKHYVGSKFSDLARSLRKEKPKIARLRPDRYILMTSQPLSPGNKSTIRNILDFFIQSTTDVMGQGDLNGLLRDHSSVEVKNFKLWFTSVPVLTRLMAQATYLNTEFAIERIKEKIQLYVHNDSFREGVKILEEHRILLISGPPGVGKTTLADMLMFGYMASDYDPVRIFDDVDEGMRVIDRNRKQIIVFDDFLGQIQLDQHALSRRDSRISAFVEAVKRSPRTRFILTTREYILRQAQSFSEHFADPRFSLYKYLLDVGSYTRMVRARILYNHLYFSGLEAEYRRAMRLTKTYLQVIDHRNFNPRVISWISDSQYMAGVVSSEYPALVLRTLDNPANLWAIAFRKHLSRGAQTLLITLTSLRDRSSLSDTRVAFGSLHMRLSHSLNHPTSATDFTDALQETEGSFIAVEDRHVRFSNPSFREFVENTTFDNEIETKALIESICLCSQVSTINQWLGSKTTTAPSLKFIGDHFADACQRVSRLMLANEWALDESCIQLSITFAMIAKERNAPEFVGLIAELADGWAKCVSRSNMDAERMPRLIRSLRPLTQMHKHASTLLKSAKDVALLTALSEWSYMDLFYDYWDVLTEGLDELVEEDVVLFKERFETYIKDQAFDEYNEIYSVDELQTYQAKVAKIVDDIGIEAGEIKRKVSSYISEREEEEENESNDDSPIYGSRGGVDEVITSDEIIERLFDTL